MKIRFYNEDRRWYADLPEYIAQGGTKEDLEMIAGADVWLDVISECADEITLEISDQEIEGFEHKLLYLGNLSWYKEGDYTVFPENYLVWLCRVTVWLFGKYPEVIYCKEVK